MDTHLGRRRGPGDTCHHQHVTHESFDGYAEVVPAIAVIAIREALQHGNADSAAVLANALNGSNCEAPKQLHATGASFVTVKREQQLRGCIGSLAAHRPLYVDIFVNAQKAIQDPRLSPVANQEWPQLAISVSVLSAAEVIDVHDRASLQTQLRPGIDGLTLRSNGKRATFLPTVWQSLPQPAQFVSALFRKAGWDDSSWPSDMTAERYSTQNFASAPPRPALEDA